MKLLAFLTFTAFMVSGESIAQDKDEKVFSTLLEKDALPVPKESGQLFYLQRDPNSNTVIYALNMEDGKLDEKNPVEAYWIRYAEGGRKTGLSLIQRKLAYGIHHEKVKEDEYQLQIQAYKSLPIFLKLNKKDARYQAYTKVNDKEVVLEKIFVRITGGSLFNPDVEYVEISGYDPSNKAKISKRFAPN